MEKKIATSVEVLIQPARFESIRITKYSEAKIEYSSEEERIKMEDELQSEVMDDVIRSMRGLPDKFAKVSSTVVEDFGGNVRAKIPEWLENGPEPNIVDPNGAQRAHEKSLGEAHAEEEDSKAKPVETDSTTTEMEELFGPDPEPSKPDPEPKVEEKVEKVEEVKEEPKVEEKAEVEDDDDEDLFA